MSTPTLNRFVVIVSSLLLAACASTAFKQAPKTASSHGSLSRKDAIAKLDKTEVCCGSFADFKFDHELPDRPKPFHIGPGQPVANFSGTHSYFLAFKLPQGHKLPYRILLKSELGGGHWLHSSYLFAPSTVLLDASYRPVKIKDVQLCEYMGWTNATSGAFGSITVNSPQARYLVVYSSGNQLDGSTYWEQSSTSFSAQNPVAMAANGSFQIPHGPTGTVYVGLVTKRYRNALSESICGKQKQSGNGVLSTLRSLVNPGSGDTAH